MSRYLKVSRYAFILILLFYTGTASAQKVAEFKETQFADAQAQLETKRQKELQDLDKQIAAKWKEYEDKASTTGDIDLVVLVQKLAKGEAVEEAKIPPTLKKMRASIVKAKQRINETYDEKKKQLTENQIDEAKELTSTHTIKKEFKEALALKELRKKLEKGLKLPARKKENITANNEPEPPFSFGTYEVPSSKTQITVYPDFKVKAVKKSGRAFTGVMTKMSNGNYRISMMGTQGVDVWSIKDSKLYVSFYSNENDFKSGKLKASYFPKLLSVLNPFVGKWNSSSGWFYIVLNQDETARYLADKSKIRIPGTWKHENGEIIIKWSNKVTYVYKIKNNKMFDGKRLGKDGKESTIDDVVKEIVNSK